MGVQDSGWNVLKLGKRLRIEDRIIVTESGGGLPCIPDEILNVIYNACDVGINTSTGEGWGLPNFEHAATGKAQIVPRSAACAEIWSGCAEFLEPVMDLTYERTLVEGKIVSPQGVAVALENLYRSREHREQVARACYERAIREEYRWDVIGKQWHHLFQEVVYG
jgi:glycosyltransferase involved in cell wall biosynthesis